MTDFSTTPSPMDASFSAEFEALQAVIRALTPLSEEARQRILQAAFRFLNVDSRALHLEQHRFEHPASQSKPAATPYSDRTTMSPKEFLHEKAPKTDVERIACLAFYLTHYRDTPNFKTYDLTTLNTEAAQPRFANAATSASNAAQSGYLVPSIKGTRQLSAVGERFVLALPDRDAAQALLAQAGPRKRVRVKSIKKTK